jgi:ATP-dependent Clp protease ATP-binding subunit ClpB
VNSNHRDVCSELNVEKEKLEVLPRIEGEAVERRRDMAQTNIPLDPTKTGSEAKRLERDLHGLVVGQDEAIEQVVNLYQAYLTGMTVPGRPIGNFLFLGPSGSGKTRMVEATAECLVKNRHAVIKIDCGEFQHGHEIAKLIGSPPGYLGHRETHAVLSQEVLNQYHTPAVRISFVLFDEIEKANDALWNLLLGVLDKGTLTLGDNRKVDFSQAMIFMTSNVGASEMNALVSPKLGFVACESVSQGATDRELDGKIARSGVEAARRKFTPEFINRLDKIVTFKPLGSDQLRRILDIELKMVQQRIFNAAPERSFIFEVTNPARDLLLSEGTDMKYGARHLKRAIERLLVQPICSLIATSQVHRGDCIRVDWNRALDHFTFTKEAEGLPFRTMMESLGGAMPAPAHTTTTGILFEVAKAPKARFSRPS